MHRESISFTNNMNQTLFGWLYKGIHSGKHGVVFSHGLFSSRDAYKITSLAGDITTLDFCLLTFDFSFINEKGGDFSRFSVLQEVEDLRCAVDYLLRKGVENIHLIGSSMGGLVSVMYAAKNHPAVKSLTLIATPFKINEMLRSLTGLTRVDDLPEEGTTPIEGIGFPNSFFRESLMVNMPEIAGRITAPVMIIHGDGDRVVAPDNARALYENLTSKCSLHIIEGGDHNLTAPEHIVMLKKLVTAWLEKNRGR